MCAELLGQVALAPSFKPWELSDIERLLRVNVLQLSQSPSSSEYCHAQRTKMFSCDWLKLVVGLSGI